MRVAALGRTGMLWNTIRALAADGHEVALIATCRAAPEYKVKEDDFGRLAAELGAEFVQTQSLNSPGVIARLEGARAAVAVSVNWINIIGEGACGAFPHGVLNAHAGDLPRYRGNAPVAWAILQGEERVGITIHQMDPFELDAGPVLLKEYVPLTEATYVGEVFAELDERVPRMFVEAVGGLARGTLAPRPQPADPSVSLRCYPRRPEDGLIRWGLPALQLARLVRASAEPFAGAFTSLNGARLTVWRARAVAWPAPSLAVPGQAVWRDAARGEVGVAAGDGVLVVEEVEPEGGARCAPASLVKSLRDRLG
jgi:UDP-4-amino-4-deoxy-L-arabinose formyltransferase/UDP-glucuronic acid dehydrogenase (UDP-4-keto-hexauronic acid decarboxylating)